MSQSLEARKSATKFLLNTVQVLEIGNATVGMTAIFYTENPWWLAPTVIAALALSESYRDLERAQASWPVEPGYPSYQ
jgi:hypothetical protein